MNAARRTLRPLALLDWGIGGLSVRAALALQAPGLAVTYVSDSGFTPYGLLSRSDLQNRLSKLLDTLAARGVKRVFFACNAASTALNHRAPFALPVNGMIEPGVRALTAFAPQRVGIVAGRRTVYSGVYRRRLKEQGICSQQRIAQPLSAAIERGHCNSEPTRALVRRVVAPLAELDAILLACTHYPAAISAFRAALPHMQFVDPAHEAAAWLLGACSSDELVSGEDAVVTTGDRAQMRRAAFAAFGVTLPDIGNL